MCLGNSFAENAYSIQLVGRVCLCVRSYWVRFTYKFEKVLIVSAFIYLGYIETEKQGFVFVWNTDRSDQSAVHLFIHRSPSANKTENSNKNTERSKIAALTLTRTRTHFFSHTHRGFHDRLLRLPYYNKQTIFFKLAAINDLPTHNEL